MSRSRGNCGKGRKSARRLAGLWVGVLAASLTLQGLVASRAGAVPGCSAQASDAAAAWAAARSCGGRVEDVAQRSETVQVYANPDGTWAAEVAAQPVRVRGSDGAWAPVDLTLARRADGSIAPVASPVAVTLSAGGSGVLVGLSVGSASLALSWPGSLPAPTLADARATYGEVLPGVDLVLTATTAGVDEVLVVKSRQAASNPALGALRFATTTHDLTLKASGSGVVALDASGSPAVAMGAPLMWDSTTAQSPAADASGVSGPGAVAKRAAVPLRISGQALVMSPVADMLTAADTRYPVFLDPAVSVTRSGWAMINSRFPDQEYWDFDRDEHAKVGWTNVDNSGNTVPSMVYRSLIQFATSAFRGKHVLGATMTDYLIHSWQCADSVTELHQSSQSLGIGTTWSSNAGSWGSTLATVSDNNCRDASGVTAQWAGSGLTNAVASVAGGSASFMTLGLKASDESSTAGWKKFDENNAKLNVTYNSYPNTPDTLTIEGKACGTGTNKAYVSTLGGHNPVLRARLSDGDSADHLTGNFSWTTSGGTATGSQANITNGQYAQVTTTGTAFTPGTTYSFAASASDGTDSSKSTGGPCEFVVDNTTPNTKPSVASADGRYPSDDGSVGWHDGVGKTGSFTFGPNGVSDGGVDDVMAYFYGLGTSPVTSVSAASMGGSATLSVTPSSPGVNDLYVRSMDRAGNLGPVFDYRFFVGSGAPPVGLWQMNEGSGTTAVDTGSGGHPLTLTGGAGWTSGRVIGTSAVSFNGTSASASTGTSAITTTASFSVAAWVRLSSTAPWGTVLCQQGTHVSGALLQHTPNGGWAFTVHTADANDPVSVRATSSQSALNGVWTHVAGVYDSGAGQIRLYVNGAPVASTNATVSWNATGPLIVGREWFDNTYMSYFPGDITDVRVWDRVVSTDEVTELAGAKLAAQWDMDDGAGNIASDLTDRHNLTLSAAGATWATAGHNDVVTGDPGALIVRNGGHADTSGPVVKTNQSFTVSAWVWRESIVTSPENPPGDQFVLCQAGANVHAFELGWAESSKKWVFRTVTTDVAGAGGSTLAATSTAAGWTFLVGVWDAQASQMRFYVNGAWQASANVGSPFSATGPLTIGRTFDGGYLSPLYGYVDDVRLFAGALSEAQISALYNQ